MTLQTVATQRPSLSPQIVDLMGQIEGVVAFLELYSVFRQADKALPPNNRSFRIH